MTAIFEKYARLKQLYPDDVEQIEMEQKRVSALLKQKEYSLNPNTQELISLCRGDILRARKHLATDRSLLSDQEAQRELWAIIDARKWVLEILARDFDAELVQIEKELEAELKV